ncbi:1496_t:CDS:2, partial [Gigaspora rosea]
PTAVSSKDDNEEYDNDETIVDEKIAVEEFRGIEEKLCVDNEW